MTTNDYAEPAAALTSGRMPLLGFGTWQISNRDASQATAYALQAGYRHIDTATMYQNESGIGKALASVALPRESVFVTTKLPPAHAGRERRTLGESLTKLGLDYVDLWLVHWPPNGQAAPRVWQQFILAQQEGLTKAIGVSNYSLRQIDELIQVTGVVPQVNQIRWGPSLYDPAMVSGLQQRGVVLEGYSPFKVSNLKDPTLVSIATRHDATAAQVIVAWHVAHGFVVIPKSVRRERIVANAAGVRIELTPEEVAMIDDLSNARGVGSSRTSRWFRR
ncbi:MAG TPA: aldo/keto reductase [Propionibacteriaceae bacterium]|nr:aldo/keto reductase [Propionibacteriaceae bacterium]